MTDLEQRVLVRFKTSDRVVLADIRRQRGREAFGAMEELLISDNRDRTRRWGAFIRDKTDPSEVQGIAYNSTVETAALGKTSFVLWQDRLPDLVLDVQKSIALHEPKGIDLILKALDGFDVFFS